MARIVTSGMAALFIASAMSTRAVAQTTTAPASRDSAAIIRVVDQFHHALAEGDSAAAAGLLHAEVIVLESGALEMRADYLRHHLPADITFARSVRTERQVHRVTQRGDVAWVASTSRTTGEFEGRPVDSDGAELMVLHRTPGGWRIASIHWSSRRHRSS